MKTVTMREFNIFWRGRPSLGEVLTVGHHDFKVVSVRSLDFDLVEVLNAN